MPETKRAIEERARQGGWWEAFKSVRERLKRLGVAVNDAWTAAVELFPPNALWTGERPAIPDELVRKYMPTGAIGPLDRGAKPARFQRLRAARHEVVEWVAQNISNTEVTPEDCVCPEAWNLLAWVRRSIANEQSFWTQMYTKADRSKDEERQHRGDNIHSLNELLDTLEQNPLFGADEEAAVLCPDAEGVA